MHIKSYTRAVVIMALASLAIASLACSAVSQGLNSRQFDNLPAAKGGDATAPATRTALPVLQLELSVADAYRAIPHRRTPMDFAASDMPEQDRRYLEVAFQLIDQAIRLRVTAYQKFARGDAGAVRLIADMDRLIEFLDQSAAPASLTNYQKRLRQALSEQRAFFADWQEQGRAFQYGAPNQVGAHINVQRASNALKAAYDILMQTYPGEGPHNQAAFFDYHCALDFI